jgi:hypothetical protein
MSLHFHTGAEENHEKPESIALNEISMSSSQKKNNLVVVLRT